MFLVCSLTTIRVDKEEFKILASEIERIFPTESAATYYVAYKVKNGTRSNESGKLYNHFEYAKGKLRSQGIIKPAFKSGERSDSVKQIVVLLDRKNPLNNHILFHTFQVYL